MGEVVIGWVLGADLRDPGLLEAYTEARARFLRVLAEQFPEYRWKTAYAERRVHLPRGGLAAVGLLEMAVDEALHRHWDFAFTIVPNELLPHHRPTAMGVASKALEAGVISTSRLGSGEELIERIVALALHLFGHFFGLPHRDEGPMRPVSDPEELRVEPFSEAERAAVRQYIENVVLVRLEEIRPRWNAWSFYLETFFQDPRAVLEAIWEHRPWRMPLFLGRLTAAAAVSTVYLLMSSDAWALAAHLTPGPLLLGTVLALFAASLFLFLGQDVGALGHERAWREQLARARMVLFGALFLGLAALWAVVLALTLLAAWALPHSLLVAWAGGTPRWSFALFAAMVGVVAAALGGNLEEEAELKAELFIDEEL